VRFETSPDDLFARLVNLALSKVVDDSCDDHPDVSKMSGQMLRLLRQSGSPGGTPNVNSDEAEEENAPEV